MFLREYSDKIQDRIIAELDKHDTNTILGGDMLAVIAISARQVISSGKPNKFIIEFAESLNITVSNYDCLAERILSELYPLNSALWSIHDKINTDRLSRSAWLNNQHLIGA